MSGPGQVENAGAEASRKIARSLKLVLPKRKSARNEPDSRQGTPPAATAAPGATAPPSKPKAPSAKTQPAAETAQPSSKPTLVTSCESCHRIGIRKDILTPVDDQCRYCGSSHVRVRCYGSRRDAERFRARYARKNPLKPLEGQPPKAPEVTPEKPEAGGGATLEGTRA